MRQKKGRKRRGFTVAGASVLGLQGFLLVSAEASLLVLGGEGCCTAVVVAVSAGEPGLWTFREGVAVVVVVSGS